MVLRFVALALLLLATGQASAQPAIIEATPPGEFNESYDDSAPVSGSPLVGLRLGGEPALSGNNVVVAGPPAIGDGVCLRVTTRDGRFSAANFYELPKGSGGVLVRVTPLSKDHTRELGSYPADEVAFRAFASATPECSPGGAVNLPLYDGAPAANPQLVVFANGKSQPATASLYDTDEFEAPAGLGPFATVDCTPAGGTMIAYDLICAVPLPAGFSGHALLAVEFSDGFTTDRYAYRTFVPRLAAP
jgi:hypothetical protein